MRRFLYLIVIFFTIMGFVRCGKTNKEFITNEDVQIIDTSMEETAQEFSDSDENSRLNGRVICVDAGHGLNSYNKQEPIAPNSSQTKNAFSSGTHGENLTEEELNLIIALELESKLKELGATVHMTRSTHECDMTNIDRAEFANKFNADISVKIHADGLENSTIHGISMLVPSNKYINNESLCNESRKAGEVVLKEVIKSTGADSRGVVERSDLTGFNWTKVPIILLEVGFMTNKQEDAKLETKEYQQKIVEGIVNGLLKYFGC